MKLLLFPFRVILSLITGNSNTTPFEQGVMGLALQHTDWKVSSPSLISIASGQLPNGQSVTFIGLCGRWFPLPKYFQKQHSQH
jgi:hypothetical protein